MHQFVVVAYPEPIALEAQAVENETIPEDSVAMAYYFRGHMIARGVVTPEAVRAIRTLLKTPVSVALAAAEDDDGNIDGRVCLILPVDPDEAEQSAAAGDEPWKTSVPAPPPEVETGYGAATGEEGQERPHLALLPIGNVVRHVGDRNHPEDVAGDAREMLANLLSGRSRDAVAKVIDDLLDSL